MRGLIIGLVSLLSFASEAQASEFLSKFGEEKKVIGCINSLTYEIRNPVRGGCLIGKNYQNLMIPSRKDAEVFLEIFGNDRTVVNRFPIVNFESGFDENAQNAHAIGYVQTLRKWGVSKDIRSQLEWLKNRNDNQKTPSGSCRSHIDSGESRLMRCLYARHYGTLDAFDWYPEKAMRAREFYISYFY